MAARSRRSSEVLAVELGEKTIKVIQGPSRRKNLVINKVLLVDTPAGCVDQYIISDWEKLGAAFKHEIFTRTKARKIMFVMDHPEIIKRRLTLNHVDDDDLPGLVKYRLEEYLGFDMENYIVQFSKIQEMEDARGLPALDVFVSALPKYIAESYVGLCQELGLEPYLLDTKTNVLQNMVQQGLPLNGKDSLDIKRTLCFVEMGQDQMEVNIFTNGYFQYNHIMDQGLQNVFQTLDQEFHLGAAEIEAFILSSSLESLDRSGPDDPWPGPEGPIQFMGEDEAADLLHLYSLQLTQWIDNLHRVLLLFGGGRDKIHQIFVYGDAFDYPGMETLLRQRIRSDIEMIRDIGSLTMSRRLDYSDSGWYRFINLIGLMAK